MVWSSIKTLRDDSREPTLVQHVQSAQLMAKLPEIIQKAVDKAVRPLRNQVSKLCAKVTLLESEVASNTRVVNQKELEFFREELQTRLSSNYNVTLKERKLPMSLLNYHKKVCKMLIPWSNLKVHLLDNEPFADAFGPKAKRKRPKLMALDYEALAKKADVSQDDFEDKHGASTSMDENGDGFRDLVRHTMFEKGQSKRIWGELYKVIDSSDVVLDARDPCGTRCYHLEKHLTENCKHKHMVLLLNKCDLVPAWATKGWLRVLSKEYPTLAFLASVTKSFGKGSLLSVLRQISRLKSDKQAISAGFVGYPNVGKSSVINTLRTENRILIECPGVVYQNHDSETDIVLKGVVRLTNLHDASEHIGEVLNCVKKEHLQRLCKSTGKLLKMILHDWQRGKIPFFVPPPKLDDDASDEQNELVSEADPAVDDDRTTAAKRAIADVVSSQQLIEVPVQEDLFSKAKLLGEN
ncbi:unnamed protein product [Withania somnifera]